MATSKVLKPRRGSTAEHSTFKGQAFEITFDTDKKTVVAHDGLTTGGFPLAHEADVATVDSELRSLIDQKISDLEGVSSSELTVVETALRSLINLNAQQQSARDSAQDDALTSLNSTLRALIAEEVGDAETSATGQVTALDNALRALIAEELAKYLPLTAGEDVPLTGNLRLDKGAAWAYVGTAKTESVLTLSAGLDFDEGPTISLYGMDTSSPGNLALRTGTNQKTLWMSPTTGRMSWDGKQVEVRDAYSNSTHGYYKFGGGLQVCWGSNITDSGSTKKVIQFPREFTVRPGVVAVGTARSAKSVSGVTTSEFQYQTDDSNKYPMHYIAVGIG